MSFLLDAHGRKINFQQKDIENGHFATRAKQNDFISLLKMLPDPDPILRKQGKDFTVLKSLLVDSHMESNWSVRISAVSGCEFDIVPADEDKKSVMLCDFVKDVFKNINIHNVIEEMMESVAYGFKPVELIWNTDSKYWTFSDIVGKPAEWFSFDKDNNCVLKKNFFDFEELPKNKFVIVQHRASFDNPFGVKAFSKCFWPVTFKRNGFKWWTTFVEKYGGAFIFGTYPAGRQSIKDELIESFSEMVADAVSAVPEGTKVEIVEATGKAQSSQVFEKYIEMSNQEISKSILGQTLTTQTSSHGNLATAQVHELVRQDLIISDKRRIKTAFQEIINILIAANFTDALPPKFVFKEKENYEEKAKRDQIVFGFSGYKPTKDYLINAYNYQKTDFEEKQTLPRIDNNNFSNEFLNRFKDRLNHFSNDEKTVDKKPNLCREEKAIIKDDKITNEYFKKQSKNMQSSIDSMIDNMFSSIKKSKSLDEVPEMLLSGYPDLNFSEIAKIMNGLNYVASQTGCFSVGKNKGDNSFSKKKTSL